MKKFIVFILAYSMLIAPAYAICGSVISQSSGINAPGEYILDYGQGAGQNHRIPYARLSGNSCQLKAGQLQTLLQQGEDQRTPKASFGIDDPDRFLDLDKGGPDGSPIYFDAQESSVVSANPEDNTWIISRCNLWTVECNATNNEFIITRSNPQ